MSVQHAQTGIDSDSTIYILRSITYGAAETSFFGLLTDRVLPWNHLESSYIRSCERINWQCRTFFSLNMFPLLDEAPDSPASDFTRG